MNSRSIKNAFISVVLIFSAVKTGITKDMLLLGEIRHNYSLIETGVSLIRIKGFQYLISIGNARIKNSSDKKMLLRARSAANIKAERGLMEFIHGTDIQIREVLTSKIMVSEQNGKIDEESNEDYFEEIKERGDGLIAEVQEIGSWHENQEYFLVLGVKIN
jgi:hypothetical protein